MGSQLVITIVGTGYVGLPLAIEFSKKQYVYAYDIDKNKINEYKNKYNNPNLIFVSESDCISKSDVVIIAVPTPVDCNNLPDLTYIKDACKVVGNELKPNTTIIFESSYMPGTTENTCIPIIEKNSGLTYNQDFFVGYSPERINPSDKVNTLNNITKIISANDEETLEKIDNIYKNIDNLKTYKVLGMKIAELSKMVENAQRDVNIAFINDISKICHALNISTYDVLNAAKTKWNFYDVNPGLVGGHCISVDPYYLLNVAMENNVNIDVVQTARLTNENMVNYIADKIDKLIMYNIKTKSIKIGIYGYAYKDNIDDTRNTKIENLKTNLHKRGYKNIIISDYFVSEPNIKYAQICNVDVLIFALAHDEYKKIQCDELMMHFNSNKTKKIVIDLKGMYRDYKFPDNVVYWCI